MTYGNRLNSKILALLTALYLVAGCSSGSAGGGAGAVNSGVTADGIVFSASVNTSDNISVDSITSTCPNTDPTAVPELEPGQTTTTGVLTISAQSTVSLVDPNLFPSGVTFNGYTTSYTSQSNAAPRLVQRHHAQSITLVSGTSTVTAPIILLDVGPTLSEFNRQNPGGTIYNYQVSIRLTGRTLSGLSITLQATTFLEVGDFNLCA